MKRLNHYKKIKKQAGVTLLELLVAITIMSSIVVGLVSIMDNQTNDTKASIVALHEKTVGIAANQYIKDNYSAITSVATSNNPALIRISDLIAGGYLSAGYSVTNARNQSSCVLVLQPTPNNLIGMVVTQGGDTIDDITLGQIAATIGGDGGAIYSSSPTGVRGSMGGWYLDMSTSPYSGFYGANNLGQNCDGTGGTPSLNFGHPAMSLWFSNGTTVSATLYRNAVPGNPTLNTMNTPILMGAGTVQTVGAACASNGAIGSDANGNLVSCVSGTWKNPGSQYWQDPVLTFSALPICNASSINQTRVVQTPSVGSGPRAYTCNGAGSWLPLSIDDSGNITIPGKATINQLGGNLQITSIATLNQPCSSNGMVASDSNGLLLSCQSGRWLQQGYKGFFHSGSGGYYVGGGCGPTCSVANPVTGGCSCPAGSSGYIVSSVGYSCGGAGWKANYTVSCE